MPNLLKQILKNRNNMATRGTATVNSVDKKIDSHIDVCAVRYEKIECEMRGMNARLKRIEMVFLGSAGAIILLLLNLVLKVG
jgi:hypothetical protein